MATDGLNSDYTPMSIDTDVPSPERIAPVAPCDKVLTPEEAVASTEVRQEQQLQMAHTLGDPAQQHSEAQQQTEPVSHPLVASESAPIEDQPTVEVVHTIPPTGQTNGHEARTDASAVDDDEPSPKRVRKLSPSLEDNAVPAFQSEPTEPVSAPAPFPAVAPASEAVPPTVADSASVAVHVPVPAAARAPVPAPIATQPFSVAAPVIRDGTQTPTAYSAFDEPSGDSHGESILTKEQHKYCTAMVRALKKHRDAGPFLKPVDIVALNIPDYPTIVKTPMDLSTIERKLKMRHYVDTQAFTDDMRLMINNCYMYNGRESVVGNMAANIEVMFDSQLKKMPAGIDTALAEHNRREFESGSRTPGSVARPKRDAHPPPSRDMPNLQRKKSRTADPQMRFCLNITKEFMKKANFNIAYPFLEPVDPVAMNCPDYFTIIKDPMDLTTIKTRLERDEYMSPLQFESDMRLMLRNCYAYNPPGHPVHEAGRALEAMFDSKWTELPSVRASQSPLSYSGGAAIAHSPPVGGEDEFDKHVYGADEEIEVDAPKPAANAYEIRDLEMQVLNMARQIEELKRGGGGGDSSARRRSSVRRSS
ncbi:hypothetical protein H4S03_000768, partial [Coemansia sp. S3946]